MKWDPTLKCTTLSCCQIIKFQIHIADTLFYFKFRSGLHSLNLNQNIVQIIKLFMNERLENTHKKEYFWGKLTLKFYQPTRSSNVASLSLQKKTLIVEHGESQPWIPFGLLTNVNFSFLISSSHYIYCLTDLHN